MRPQSTPRGGSKQPLTSRSANIPLDHDDPLESKYRQLVLLRRREEHELRRLKLAQRTQQENSGLKPKNRNDKTSTSYCKGRAVKRPSKVALRTLRHFTDPRIVGNDSPTFTQTESCPNLKLVWTYDSEKDPKRKAVKMATRCHVRTKSGDDTLSRILLFLLKRTVRTLHDTLTLVQSRSPAAKQAFERSASQLVRIADMACSTRDPVDLQLTPSEGELIGGQRESSLGCNGDATSSSDRWARKFRRHLSAPKMRHTNVKMMLEVLAWEVARFYTTWCKHLNKNRSPRNLLDVDLSLDLDGDWDQDKEPAGRYIMSTV